MPDYGLRTGLPDRPAAVTDKDASLVMPLYTAVNNLARNASEATGLVSYTQAELAQRSQVAGLRSGTANRLYARAIGALDYGKLVHLVLDVDKIGAEYADSTTNAKPAVGIVNAPFGIADNEFGEILLFTGFTAGVAGTTIGVLYYLGPAGVATAVRPAAVGTIIQAVGMGLGSAGLYLNISSLFIQN